MKRITYPVFLITACVALTGCPANNQVTLPPPGSNPLALFAGNAGTSLKIFTLPIGSTSAASTTVSGFSDAVSVAFDQSNHAFVLDNQPVPPVISEFNRPITNSSTLIATIAVTGTTDCDFVTQDASGNLWVSCHIPAEVVEINGPFTATGSYSGSIGAKLTGLSNPQDLTFDSSGNLYVTDFSGNVVAVFKAPVSTGTPSGTLTANNPVGVAIDAAGNVYADNRGDGSLRRWNTPVPLTTSGVAANIIDPSASTGFTGGVAVEGMTFDASGNLYVANESVSGSIIVFSLSGGFSTSTTPTFTDTATGRIFDIDSHIP